MTEQQPQGVAFSVSQQELGALFEMADRAPKDLAGQLWLASLIQRWQASAQAQQDQQAGFARNVSEPGKTPV